MELEKIKLERQRIENRYRVTEERSRLYMQEDPYMEEEGLDRVSNMAANEVESRGTVRSFGQQRNSLGGGEAVRYSWRMRPQEQEGEMP